MRLEAMVLREPGEHPLPRGLAIPIARPSHRPPIQYRFQVRSERDVQLLNRHRLPIHLLTAERVTALGYPIVFPPQAVIGRSFRPLVETRFGVIPFASTEAASAPREEDVIVALLRFDMLGARAVWNQSGDRLDPRYLLRRIQEENVERRAALVRFSDVLPGIPESSDALDRDRLETKLRKHRADRRSA